MTPKPTPTPTSTLKTLGLLGGMSWESSAHYYRIINQHTQAALGGLHSASTLMHSYDFAAIAALQSSGDWAGAGALLAHTAVTLADAGAHAIVLCTNTMHKCAPAIEQALAARTGRAEVKLLHIVDPTGRTIVGAGVKKVGLLGTRFTMVEGFYKDRLKAAWGVDVVIPREEELEIVHSVIYEELVRGLTVEMSRRAYVDIIRRLVDEEGAEGVVLGCTEIGILIKQEDVPGVKLFDTTELHAVGAAQWALEDVVNAKKA